MKACIPFHYRIFILLHLFSVKYIEKRMYVILNFFRALLRPVNEVGFP